MKWRDYAWSAFKAWLRFFGFYFLWKLALVVLCLIVWYALHSECLVVLVGCVYIGATYRWWWPEIGRYMAGVCPHCYRARCKGN